MLETSAPQLHIVTVSALNHLEHFSGEVLEMGAESSGVLDLVG